MGEIVNLGRVKKQRARAAAEAKAAANRALHGRTKGEKRRDAATEARREATLDGARLESEPPGTPPAKP